MSSHVLLWMNKCFSVKPMVYLCCKGGTYAVRYARSWRAPFSNVAMHHIDVDCTKCDWSTM